MNDKEQANCLLFCYMTLFLLKDGHSGNQNTCVYNSLLSFIFKKVDQGVYTDNYKQQYTSESYHEEKIKGSRMLNSQNGSCHN